MAIMMIITAVVLGNFPGFRDKTSLDLIAQEVAITIRQAQEYSVGTRGYSSIAGATNKFPSFGINFPSFTGSTLNNFNFYADNDNNKYYSSANDSRVENYEFRGAVTIIDILDPAEASLKSNNLSIVFHRPDPDAKFYKGAVEDDTLNYVKIKLGDNKGGIRYVCVWKTGHIFAFNPANVSNC